MKTVLSPEAEIFQQAATLIAVHGLAKYNWTTNGSLCALAAISRASTFWMERNKNLSPRPVLSNVSTSFHDQIRQKYNKSVIGWVASDGVDEATVIEEFIEAADKFTKEIA